jgi:hypothetical protein
MKQTMFAALVAAAICGGACWCELAVTAQAAEPGAASGGAAGAKAPLFQNGADGKVEIFNGKDLSGWQGDPKFWSVQDGEIVAKSDAKHGYSYLTSTHAAENFRLVLQIKLVPNSENSGIQFRSESLGHEEMRGPQADAGQGWWGKLYEEHARGIIDPKGGEQWVKPDDWNTYEIVAVGAKIRTAINGHPCVDLDDDKVSKRGIFGLQMHAGGPMEVRFRSLQLELNPKFELKTVAAER